MHITLVNDVRIVLTWYKTESFHAGKLRRVMCSMIITA